MFFFLGKLFLISVYEYEVERVLVGKVKFRYVVF